MSREQEQLELIKKYKNILKCLIDNKLVTIKHSKIKETTSFATFFGHIKEKIANLREDIKPSTTIKSNFQIKKENILNVKTRKIRDFLYNQYGRRTHFHNMNDSIYSYYFNRSYLNIKTSHNEAKIVFRTKEFPLNIDNLKEKIGIDIPWYCDVENGRYLLEANEVVVNNPANCTFIIGCKFYDNKKQNEYDGYAAINLNSKTICISKKLKFAKAFLTKRVKSKFLELVAKSK